MPGCLINQLLAFLVFTEVNMEEKAIICPHCGRGVLELVLENFPWTTDHWQCNCCDSTYNLESTEVETNK